MDAIVGAAPVDPRTEISEFARCPRQRFGVMAGADDGGGDGAGAALLAEVVEDIGEAVLLERVDQVRGGRALFGVPMFEREHAHVERTIVLEGKAAFGLIELH